MLFSHKELAQIQSHHRRRLHLKIRAEFTGEGNDADTRGRYFDAFITEAESLPSSNTIDHLIILQIGWLQRIPVGETVQFRECLARGTWYGRRLWLTDQLERIVSTGEKQR